MEHRQYLTSHDVHRVLEDCIRDLVLARPDGHDEVVKSLLDSVERRRAGREGVYIPVLFAGPRDDAALQALVDEYNREKAPASAVLVSLQGVSLTATSTAIPTPDAASREDAAQDAPVPLALVTHLDNMANAILLNSTHGLPRAAYLVITDHNVLDANKDLGSIDREFLLTTNPIASYYRSLGILQEVAAVKDIQI